MSSYAFSFDVDHSNSPRTPPIAIVGVAAELPGARTVDELWKVLQDGVNTLQEIPACRFDASMYAPGMSDSSVRVMNVSHGNFLEDLGAFDNAFFQISPREAPSMDPQQRVLLRTAYHALEDAGYCPAATPAFDPHGIATFIGVATNDYVQNLRDSIDVYYSTGTLQAFLSGRISYAFGFGGPSMVIDTACSSSMVAIHQACRALTAGDCNSALAGGVNVITSPDMYLGLARGHFLSETGQCKPWDASADGYCRAEGCGVFVLKRLDDALAEDDRIMGVIRGVEVNQSGNARSITHPHVPAQTALFEKLVRSTDIDPLDVSVAECHGTGTQAGDPAELEAIRTVFAVGRGKDNPLHITSIKANIGHSEAASGVASLAKLVLMMQHHAIPRHVSFKKLSPRIPDLSIDNVRIDTTTAPWTCAAGKPRLALLTNFGAAGSNSALILEEHVPPLRLVTFAGSLVFGMSCKTFAALEERRRAYISYLEDSAHADVSLHDFAYSATARRQLYEYRISICASTREDLLASLRRATIVKTSPGASAVVFVFSGQGSQYVGMGKDLYRSLPVFARIVDDCHHKLVARGYPGILDAFEDSNSLDKSDIVHFQTHQLALFALEYALARVWMSWGVRPCAVAGHSFGEFAALVVAGVLSLEDALHVVARRAELLASKCKRGETGMTSICGQAERFNEVLGCGPYAHLEVCCHNSVSSFVVGGPLGELRAFEAICATKRIRYTRLDVPYAYHSSAMDAILGELEALSDDIPLAPPVLPVLSNVTGTLVQPGDTSTFGPGYFAHHCRYPARFRQGIASLLEHIDISSIAAFIEVGPHPTTLPLLREKQENGVPLLLPSLKKAVSERDTLTTTLAQLYCTCVPVQWRRVFADLAPGARPISLPGYPFAQNRFWVSYEEPSRRTENDTPAELLSRSRHALLGRCVRARPGEGVFETELSALRELIQGHRVTTVPLCPASVYAELALSAAAHVARSQGSCSEDDAWDSSDVVYPKPLVFPSGRPGRLRVEVILPQSLSATRGSFTVSSASSLGTDVEVYCEGFLKRTSVSVQASRLSHWQSLVQREVHRTLHPEVPRTSDTFTTRTIYDLLFPSIVSYSDTYRTIETITVNTQSSTAYAVMKLPPAARDLPGLFSLHPVFVDTLFHVAGFLVNFTRGMNGRDAYICSGVDKMQVRSEALDLSQRYGVYTAVTREDDGAVVADAYAIEVDDPMQRIVARLKRVRFQRVNLYGFKRMLEAAAGQPGHDAASFDKAPIPLSTRPTTRSDPRRDLQRTIVDVIADTVGIPITEVAGDAYLAHLGIDSLMLWEVAAGLRALAADIGNTLSAQELAKASTVDDLVQLVLHRRGGSAGRRNAEAETEMEESTTSASDASPPPARKHSMSETRPSLPLAIDAESVKAVLSSVLDIPVSEIAGDAELHSLGLDSFSSIEARHAFQNRLGVRIHEETLFACRTVSDVVRALSRDPLPSPRPLRTCAYTSTDPQAFPSPTSTMAGSERGFDIVQNQHAPADAGGAPRAPLILVHDGSGTIGSYEHLGALGRDVWAVRNVDFTRFFATMEKIEGDYVRAMAEAYAIALCTEVFACQGDVPGTQECYVGGWSFGGVVAFELARHLAARRIRVKGLVLIDAPAPQTRSVLPDAVIDHLEQQLMEARSHRPQASDGGHPRPPPVHGFGDQMRAATRALVSYTPPLDETASCLSAVYLRASEPANAVLSCKGSEELDDRLRAFFTKQGDEWTIPSWEQALGQSITVLDVAGDHFNLFNRTHVSACVYIDLSPF
ncbi:ketoacyl-synt-domain-containing protein [Trametes polyzona]|nr:ketoacyl-synt-domain-containing protein [Trametes polyzona]